MAFARRVGLDAYDAVSHGRKKGDGRQSLDPEKLADADWLIARDFVIDYEGRLMSIVVRAWPTVTAQSLLRKAGALEEAA